LSSSVTFFSVILRGLREGVWRGNVAAATS
jgi:hypothetical protein